MNLVQHGKQRSGIATTRRRYRKQRESTQLALMLLGREDETTQDYARKIAQESQGWPFFVWEMAQHVQEDPKIADQSLDLDDVIWLRVNRIPTNANEAALQFDLNRDEPKYLGI